MTLYGQKEDGSDDKVENLKYTVSNGKASVTYNDKPITTSAIKDDTFTASLDGTEENTCTFSTTPGKKYQTPNPEPTPKPDPEPDPTPNPDPTPTTEIKTAAEFEGSIGNFDLEWKDGVAVIEKQLDASYKDGWNDNSDSTISFALLTVKGEWKEPCYKESEFDFGEEVPLKIALMGNNIITSTDPLAGKKIKLTFTGTEETIKCKAEIVESSNPNLDPDPTTKPDPNPTPTNPFAGKTFYGSQTFDEEDIKGTFDVEEIRFKDIELTWIYYGGKDGSDDYVETMPYTVEGGKATMKRDGFTITTSVITNDKFTLTYTDGTDEEVSPISYSRTQGKRIPEDFWTEDPDTPTGEETILDNAGIAGGMNGWKGSPLSKDDSAIYTYEFTATQEEVEFKVQEISGSWTDKGDWGGATIFAEEASNTPSEKVRLYYGASGNAKITNLSINSKYLLTITIDDEENDAISATVTLIK